MKVGHVFLLCLETLMYHANVCWELYAMSTNSSSSGLEWHFTSGKEIHGKEYVHRAYFRKRLFILDVHSHLSLTVHLLIVHSSRKRGVGPNRINVLEQPTGVFCNCSALLSCAIAEI